MVLTSSTGQWSRPEHRGCWQYRLVHPRRAPPPVPLRLLPAGADVSCAPEATTSSTAAATGPVLPCGAGGWRSSCARISSTMGAGLRLPAGSPTVSHTPSSPSSTGSAGGTSCVQVRLLVSNVLEQRVLDYSAQDNLPPEAWSLRPSVSSSPASRRGCAASVAAQLG
jgi:hypothetical protein